jgi:hypothetical protein
MGETEEKSKESEMELVEDLLERKDVTAATDGGSFLLAI